MNAVTKLKMTALHMAAAEGCDDVAKVLIQNGADVNAEDKKTTALHWAAEKGHVDVVKVLIQNGADVNFLCVFVTAIRFDQPKGHHLLIWCFFFREKPRADVFMARTS